MIILVSACLLGENCKYNGGNNYKADIVAYLKDKEVVPVCPEMEGGLGCPRTPFEIVNGVMTDQDGNVVDPIVRKGIAKIMETIRDEEIAYAVLQSRSPTCGVRKVYDGTFSGKLIPGSGVFAQTLKEAGIQVYDAEDFPQAVLLGTEGDKKTGSGGCGWN